MWKFLLINAFLTIVQAEPLMDCSAIDCIYSNVLSNDASVESLM